MKKSRSSSRRQLARSSDSYSSPPPKTQRTQPTVRARSIRPAQRRSTDQELQELTWKVKKFQAQLGIAEDTPTYDPQSQLSRMLNTSEDLRFGEHGLSSTLAQGAGPHFDAAAEELKTLVREMLRGSRLRRELPAREWVSRLALVILSPLLPSAAYSWKVTQGGVLCWALDALGAGDLPFTRELMIKLLRLGRSSEGASEVDHRSRAEADGDQATWGSSSTVVHAASAVNSDSHRAAGVSLKERKDRLPQGRAKRRDRTPEPDRSPSEMQKPNKPLSRVAVLKARGRLGQVPRRGSVGQVLNLDSQKHRRPSPSEQADHTASPTQDSGKPKDAISASMPAMAKMDAPFQTGERVERRWKGQEWGHGYITDLVPLKVTLLDDPKGRATCKWEEVRRIKRSAAQPRHSNARQAEASADAVSQPPCRLDACDKGPANQGQRRHPPIPQEKLPPGWNYMKRKRRSRWIANYHRRLQRDRARLPASSSDKDIHPEVQGDQEGHEVSLKAGQAVPSPGRGSGPDMPPGYWGSPPLIGNKTPSPGRGGCCQSPSPNGAPREDCRSDTRSRSRSRRRSPSMEGSLSPGPNRSRGPVAPHSRQSTRPVSHRRKVKRRQHGGSPRRIRTPRRQRRRSADGDRDQDPVHQTPSSRRR